MKVFDLDNYKETKDKTTIALGNFDGVHYGHQLLIKNMVRKAESKGLKSSILLFENHTKKYIDGIGPALLSSSSQKNNLLYKLGVERIYNLSFDNKIRNLTPEEFVVNILIHRLNVKSIFVGFDYRFGYKASGGSTLLKELGNSYGIDVEVIHPITLNNEVVSSTRIREYIKEGNLEKVKFLLNRNYSVIGKVVSGKNLGSKLGYPTANLELSTNYVIPKLGVYSTETIIDNKKYLSATSVGYNPTFNEKSIKIESHILDFNSDIYGEDVEIIFVEYLRDEMKFKDTDSLVNQIGNDIKKVKTRQNYLQNM